nr:serine/threonine-protein kinase [Kofleriaceae bacterium]
MAGSDDDPGGSSARTLVAPTVRADPPGRGPETAPASAESSPALTGTFGRFRIERELGRGGMGIVYAAFDPELERRVALKVLPRAPSDDAQARLVREARAMARLASPHVVTVFEVGTLDGQTFVAMEVMERGTLLDWLQAQRRPLREILGAFIASGRGLADAHAASLVHRDFKPANVLRARDGRFAVTDFGLARDAAGGPAARSDRRSEPVAVPRARALGDVTATGWVLGTPQYMAPEQWDNDAVTPATDQFAFCVALWEAVAGERPFRGDGDTLRAAVMRGPAAVAPSRVPRALRSILLRGLESDPGARWRSMDALIAALVRVQRRPQRIALAAAAAGVLAVGAIGAAVFARPGAPAATCVPARDPDAIWTPAVRAALVARGLGAGADLVDADVRDWHARWAAACEDATPVERACLDGVVGHLAAVVHAAAEVPLDAASADPLRGMLVPPAVCHAAQPPRLLARWSDAAERELAALATLEHAKVRDEPLPDPPVLASAGSADPCRELVALRERMELGAGSDDQDALASAEHCADDALVAGTLARELDFDSEPYTRTAYDRLLGELAGYDRDGDPVVHAEVALDRAWDAYDDLAFDAALAGFREARDAYASRGLVRSALDASTVEMRIRFARWSPSDRTGFAQDLARARDAGRGTYTTSPLDIFDVLSRWYDEPAAAHASRPPGNGAEQTVHVTGVVIDAAGKPVVGAVVAAGGGLVADALGVSEWLSSGPCEITTTTVDGRFEIAAASGGAVVATFGGARSVAASPVVDMLLEVGPTRRIAGTVRVAGGDLGHTVVAVGAPGQRAYAVMAPVAADGSFVIAGAPVGALQIGVLGSVLEGAGWWTPLAGSGDLASVALDVPAATRTVRVTVRSGVQAQLLSAQVRVFVGAPAIHTLRDMQSYEYSGTAFAQRAGGGGGGLVATVQRLPATGALTACVDGAFHDASDRELQKLVDEHPEEVPVSCAPIPATADAVELETAPARVGQ